MLSEKLYFLEIISVHQKLWSFNHIAYGGGGGGGGGPHHQTGSQNSRTLSLIVPQLSKYLKFEAVWGVLDRSTDLDLNKEI